MNTELSKWEKVNQSETIDQFYDVLLELSENGIIQGRTRSFSVNTMISQAKQYYDDPHNSINPRGVTREYGLRQQLMYLKFYKR